MLNPTHCALFAMHEVVAVARGEARSLSLEHVGQHGVLVDVGHEDPSLLRGRKGIGLVDARPAVRRSVAMVGDRLDVAVDVRVEVLASLTVIDAARDHVPEVGDDAGADDELPFGVVVDTPRVAESVGDDLEPILRRMVSPDAAIDLDAFAFQDVVGERLSGLEHPALAGRLSDLRRREQSLQSVQPPIGAPMETVQRLRGDPGCPSR